MIAAHDWTGTCERPILNVEVCEFIKRRLTANGREGVALSVRAVEYFYARMENEPGKAYELLARLAAEDINLLGFSAVPFGPGHVELTIFPERSENFQALSTKLGRTLTGPQHAILIQRDDHWAC